MLFILSILSLSTPLWALPPPEVQTDLRTASSPYDPQIQSVTFSGSGCAPGSESVQLLANGRTFTVIYDSFIASSGPGSTDNDYQKDCEVNIHFTHTPGYQFAVFSSEQRGFAQLQKGDRANIDATFGYSEENLEIRRKTAVSGPLISDYQKIDNFTSKTTNWSPCASSATLVISLEITLDAQDPNSSSQLTIDSTDFEFAQSPSTPVKTCH